jgi:streptogramin lyase
MSEPRKSGVRRAISWLVGPREMSVGRAKSKRPSLEPLESRLLLTTSVTDFALPSNSSIPTNITQGPGGNLWFTDDGSSSGEIGLINPSTRAVTEFPVPAVGGAKAKPYAITAGPDGNIWFTDYGTNSIGKITPTGVVTEYPITIGTTPDGIVSGPDGNLWFTEEVGGYIGKITPAGTITEMAIPSGSNPTGITVGSDGNIWFVEQSPSQIGMINPNTDTFSTQFFSLPAGVSSITAGPNGNIWFGSSDSGVNEIGQFNIVTDKMTPYSLNSQPVDITPGPDGAVWFTESGSDPIGVINPTTGSIHQYQISNDPTSSAAPEGITMGPNLTVWFTEAATAKVGVAALAANLAVASQPLGAVTAGAAFPSSVTVSDTFDSGMPATTGSVTVSLAGNPGGATLYQSGTAPGGTISSNLVAGVAGFSGLYVTKAGSGYSIVAATSGATPVATSTFNVVPAAATHLAIVSQPPGTITVGDSFGLQVGAYDQFGNFATSFNGNVTVVLGNNPGGASLGGATTVAANQGVATFSGLSLNKTGNGYSLAALSTGLSGTVSTGTFNAVLAVATRLQIIAQPPGTMTVGTPFGLQVGVYDQLGNIDTSFNGTVTVSLGNNPGGAGLSGTTTVTANQGVATFSGLSLNNAGTGYSLVVSGTGVSGTVSTGTFQVVSVPPVIIGASIVKVQNRNKKGKPVGKPILEVQLVYSTAMNSAAGLSSNYQVGYKVIKKVKKTKTTILKPVNVTAAYNPNTNTVLLALPKNQKFTQGGQVTVVGTPPGGVASSNGVLLNGGSNGVYTITNNLKGIAPG